MHRTLLPILACPNCESDLRLGADDPTTDVVISGVLACQGCRRTYPIIRGIPRFAPEQNYADSFGFQWQRFKRVQFDSVSGTKLSEHRFYSETAWSSESLDGKLVLDAGCGAGRFLDVVTKTRARVVGVDLSDAVDAAATMLEDRGSLDLVQASVDALPFRRGSFDAIYCIGVIQHTRDPEGSVRSLARALKPSGSIAITAYESRRWSRFYSKYWARRITRKFDPVALYRLIRFVVLILFPFTEVLFRLPLLGRLFRFGIPIADHVDLPLSLRQRYEWVSGVTELTHPSPSASRY